MGKLEHPSVKSAEFKLVKNSGKVTSSRECCPVSLFQDRVRVVETDDGHVSFHVRDIMSISMEGTMSPILAGNIMNDSIPKDEAEHLLQDLINDMNDQNFDTIRFASYRTAAKLQFIQKKTNLHLVDVYNMIEAFRENGLNTLDHNTELHELRLEAIVSSIFYALNKRLPTTHNVDVERSISLVTNWLLYAYDSDAIGRIRVLSVKTALSSMCYGRLVDKLRYHFSQIEDNNGMLNFPKFEAYLRELLQLPASVGEAPTFGFTEDVASIFFKPQGPLDRQRTQLVHFLECVMNKEPPPPYAWLSTLQKMNNAAKTEHQVACQVCKNKPVVGFRYKCLHCYNYVLCQDCFWRGKVSQHHKTDHDMREYSTWNAGEKGSSLRSKFLCGSGKKKRPSLPDFPREPEPSRTLDMTNIVPPLPSDLSGPNNATSDYVTSPSPESVVSNVSSNPTKLSDEFDPRMDDEHKLISRYAARLAANSRQKPPSKSSSELSIDANKEQRELIQTLENKNRLLLKEIRRLRDEHDEASKSAAQLAQNPELLAELKLLRQRKDELELRMSALQESRRELMVQLEGLMNLLKAGSPRVARSPKAQHIAASPAPGLFSKASTPQTPGTPMSPDSSKLSGVDGDIKQAFGDQAGSPSLTRNLRQDLLLAADSVTNAMSSLVKELNSDEDSVTIVLPKPNDPSGLDLDALEQQVTQMRHSLRGGEPSSAANLTNGTTNGVNKNSGKRALRRGDSDRTDTDTDDDEAHLRANEPKYSSRTQMTDDESYIQTDDDEGTLRTDDEDMEWQEAMKRWAHR
ncbi:dystrobrevin beta isoform X2 [Nematostella vectensis]|uniref:dystrobrevin beta isoform X2 n=1 Tax=Nematostella vectensis TaxID=45351 RepID=UPI00138FDE4E|nr:dystrobrevin beta isoform X2 [Nematostella vectensis]